MLQRPQENEYDPYYHRYISLVPEGSFLDLLNMQTHEMREFFGNFTEEGANYRYAPDKWSIKEILGHIIDSERVFAYRVLCIARGEQQSLPGFDQEAYAGDANYESIPMANVLQHYTALRVSTFFLLHQLSEDSWNRMGISNQKPISVRALAYIIVGHERHHRNVINERYR
jgi:hypothetical protein